MSFKLYSVPFAYRKHSLKIITPTIVQFKKILFSNGNCIKPRRSMYSGSPAGPVHVKPCEYVYVIVICNCSLYLNCA
jgi:hypothetical protein